jgi:CDP-diacylglycerol--serine O-phosphatidyltransferase
VNDPTPPQSKLTNEPRLNPMDRVQHDLPPPHQPARPGPEHRPSRGVYLLPNSFTIGGLFCGFYGVVQAMHGRFDIAAIAVFVAMVLDSLDGRVARLTNTQSEFGAQLDSLADMVSFGAAPALIMYEWSLRNMGKWGWLAAFVYVSGAALRLARFNTNIGVVDKRYFQGLPSPAAAALVAGLVWIANDKREQQWISLTGADLTWVAWGFTVFAGIAMVSNAPFYSFKDLSLKKKVPFTFMIGVVLALLIIVADAPLVSFLLFVFYGLSGFGLWFWRWRTGKPLPWRMPAEISEDIDD